MSIYLLLMFAKVSHLCVLIHSVVSDCDSLNSSPPGSSVHGVLLARILDWVAISFSRDHALNDCLIVGVHICGAFSALPVWCSFQFLKKLTIYYLSSILGSLSFSDLFFNSVRNFGFSSVKILTWGEFQISLITVSKCQCYSRTYKNLKKCWHEKEMSRQDGGFLESFWLTPSQTLKFTSLPFGLVVWISRKPSFFLPAFSPPTLLFALPSCPTSFFFLSLSLSFLISSNLHVDN